jgi:hypothetical protein
MNKKGDGALFSTANLLAYVQSATEQLIGRQHLSETALIRLAAFGLLDTGYGIGKTGR